MSDTNHFGKFVGHVVSATASFLFVALAALMVFYAVAFMKTQGVGTYSTELLSLAEHAIITVDLVTYLVVLARSAYRLIQETWND